MTNAPLHSESIGQGDVIVLVHGFLSSSHYFSDLRAQLARDHRVITLDLLGLGDSPKPRRLVSHDNQVAAIHAALASLGVQKPVTLVGHSMGALVSVLFARRYPSAVASLVLFNPPIFASSDDARVAFSRASSSYAAALDSPRTAVYRSLVGALPGHILARRPAISVVDILKTPPHVRSGDYQRSVLASELFLAIQEVACPLLLVNGAYDRLVDQPLLAAQQFPASVIVKTVQTGHHTIIKQPKQSESLIRAQLPSAKRP